jgi:hypothetical protein
MGAEVEQLLGRLVARFPLRTPVFVFRPVHVRFVVDRVARGQACLQ